MRKSNLRTMRRTLIAGLAAAALASTAAATTSASGVHGVVRRGPLTPVCVAEQPCDGPARGVTLRFLRGGHLAGRVTTDSHGRYRIWLAPGRYVVKIGRKASFKTPEPKIVRVRAGLFARADFHLDTGIR